MHRSFMADLSAIMREVIGRSEIQPILTGARQTIETAVQDLMQKTLDHYGAGVTIQQVQLQKVDPPAQVVDAFRDVQAARFSPSPIRCHKRGSKGASTHPKGTDQKSCSDWNVALGHSRPSWSRPTLVLVRCYSK
jgi:hypothetical protein